MGLLPILLLALPLPAADGPEQWRALMQKSVNLLTNTDANQAKLLFVKRREVQELDGSGKVKTRTVVTTAREPFEGAVVTRVIARDDKPLPEEERQRQEENLRRTVAEWRARDQAQAAGPKKPTQKADENNRMIRDFANALDYKPVGMETIDGRPARIFEFQPRPGYKPPSIKHRIFEKMRGKVWIDQESAEVVRADAEMFDDLNVGFGVVGHIGKGSTFKMERRQMAGVWVPVREQIRIQARLMLVKSFRQEILNTFSEFRPLPSSAMQAFIKSRAAPALLPVH